MDKLAEARPKLGASSCLLGTQVRFDGGHKHNAYLTQTLARYFDFVGFCPEQGIGLPTPRPPIRLVAHQGAPTIRAVDFKDNTVDHSESLVRFAEQTCAKIDDLSGYIVKKDSPSCGMERVKVYEKDAAPPVRRGIGIFTQRIMLKRPELPLEEEGRLMDPHLRENFVTRVFTMSRFRQMVNDGLTPQRLIEFHTRHKFLILAHHESIYRELGRDIAKLAITSLEASANAYIKLMMQGLRQLATPGRHANVLMHIMGFVKNSMSPDDKVELLDVIEQHRLGLLPVIVPITLLNHFLRRHPNQYVSQQYYLSPHPRELMLRNSI